MRICENCAYKEHKNICKMCKDNSKHIYDIEFEEIIKKVK